MPELLWVAGGATALLLLDRLGLWAESRGWIYWRRKRGRSLGGGLLGGLAEVLQPNQVHYVREIKQKLTPATAAGWGPSGEDELHGAPSDD